MMPLESGARIDDFVVDACIHSGGMAHIYRVHHADAARQPDFPLVMKVPRMGGGDGGEMLVGFEVERRILAALSGPHVPRFVAAGDVAKLPYIVMEYVAGTTLQQWLDQPMPRVAGEIARVGAQVAHAVESVHRQQVCHLDLKPANVLLRADGGVVLLDFGLSRHAQQPDLLAEGQRATAGSYIWMAPEQVVGMRGDPRSDVFAIGVMLYEMCTRELPFGEPQSAAGLRQRLWMEPKPPRQHDAAIPEWLQEIVLHCLERQAADRYANAALLEFDLAHPDLVKVTARGAATRGWTLLQLLGNWLAASGREYRPSPLPNPAQARTPIAMVALPHEDVSEATLQALRLAAARVLGNRPGARLACVTVVAPGAGGRDGDAGVHQQLLASLRDWSQEIEQRGRVVSHHVLEAGDVAQALLTYAESNHVDVIVLGAATHGLQMQRFVATVPIKVAMHAPCTVMLVKP